MLGERQSLTECPPDADEALAAARARLTGEGGKADDHRPAFRATALEYDRMMCKPRVFANGWEPKLRKD